MFAYNTLYTYIKYNIEFVNNKAFWFHPETLPLACVDKREQTKQVEQLHIHILVLLSRNENEFTEVFAITPWNND